MHRSVLQWFPRALPAGEVRGRRILEVGSYDVNGSVRPYVMSCEPASYLGVDQTIGPGVDRVIDAATLAESLVPDWFDIVISTEMLEHAQDWRACVAAMVNVLAPAGLWVVTTRSPGFPYHGYPDDHWRYTIDTATGIIDAAGLDMLILESDPQAPGVFWKARKPETWTGCGDLEQIQLEKAPS